MVTQATESWAGPGNEARECRGNPGYGKLAGPGNEARECRGN